MATEASARLRSDEFTLFILISYEQTEGAGTPGIRCPSAAGKVMRQLLRTSGLTHVLEQMKS